MIINSVIYSELSLASESVEALNDAVGHMQLIGPLVFGNGVGRHAFECFQFSVNAGTGIVALIRAGLGIDRPLKRFAQPWLKSGELIPVLTVWHGPSVPVHVIYPQNRHQSPRLKVFTKWSMTNLKEP